MTTKPIDPKRECIIKAATHMFLTQGFRSVSMEKIAQAAPVSKATLYNHFEGKSALLAAVVNRLCTSLIETMAQATMDTSDVETSLEKIAWSFAELIYTEEALAMYRLVIAESLDFPELGALVHASGPAQALVQLEDYLQQLNAGGLYNISNTAFAADAFFSLLKGDLHFQCLLGAKPLPTQEQKQRLVSQAMLFYRRGIFYGV